MENREKKFNHIDITHPKIHKIINAAFEVFTKNDLKKASTNQIVKLAGISRGLLYHYFEDKQELFDFLLFFSMKVTLVEMDQKINWDEKDYLNRMKQVVAIRLKIIIPYPHMMDFFQKYTHLIDKNKARQIFEQLSPGMEKKFYTYNLDFSGLKEGVDRIKMMNTVKWAIKGKLKEWIERGGAPGENMDHSINKLLAECDEYIDFFRTIFYKEVEPRGK